MRPWSGRNVQLELEVGPRGIARGEAGRFGLDGSIIGGFSFGGGGHAGGRYASGFGELVWVETFVCGGNLRWGAVGTKSWKTHRTPVMSRGGIHYSPRPAIKTATALCFADDGFFQFLAYIP